MVGLGFWASTFASAFIEKNPQLTAGLFIFGLCLIMGQAFLAAIGYASLEKRIARLEGDPETSPEPVK